VQSKASAAVLSGDLVVSGAIEHYDIAVAVAPLVLTDARFGDKLLLSTLLSLSLDSLKAKGFVLRSDPTHTEDEPARPPVLPNSAATPSRNPPGVPARQGPRHAFSEVSAEPSASPGRVGVPAGRGPNVTQSFFGRLSQAMSRLLPQAEDALLRRAAQGCVADGSHEIETRDTAEPSAVAEAESCAPGWYARLSFRGVLGGVRVYSDGAAAELPVATLQRFSPLCLSLAAVFGVPGSAVHLFWADAPVVAFNRGRSLFFNAAKFEPQRPESDNALHWFFVFCHELAHNIVGEHGSVHEHYSSLFAEKHIRKLLCKEPGQQ
jgi:hypothetical protein